MGKFSVCVTLNEKNNPKPMLAIKLGYLVVLVYACLPAISDLNDPLQGRYKVLNKATLI